MTPVKRITSRQGTSGGHPVQVWVGLGELPVDRDPEDFTLPEVTFAYTSRQALVRAIETGAAFK